MPWAPHVSRRSARAGYGSRRSGASRRAAGTVSRESECSHSCTRTFGSTFGTCLHERETSERAPAPSSAPRCLPFVKCCTCASAKPSRTHVSVPGKPPFRAHPSRPGAVPRTQASHSCRSVSPARARTPVCPPAPAHLCARPHPPAPQASRGHPSAFCGVPLTVLSLTRQ